MFLKYGEKANFCQKVTIGTISQKYTKDLPARQAQ